MLTEADILEALRVCYDPALRINIVDLGRVGSIRIQPDADAPGPDPRARIIVTLLASNTEQAEQQDAEQQDAMLAATVANRLFGIRAISHADVHITDSPAWTPSRMSPAARAELSKQRGLVQLG